jgi:hypothetical protein
VTEFRRPLHDEPRRLLSAHTTPGFSPSSCFADEIAIDFPSIARVVDRMRDGLLGDDPPPGAHSAEISLSVREASRGVTVPLDVPVLDTCGHCGGRGETWAEPCGLCAGSGACSRRRQVPVSVPAGVADGTRFRFVIAPHGVPTHIEVTVLVA